MTRTSSCEIPCGPCNIHTYMFGRSRDLLAQRYDKGATHFVGMPRKGRKLWWRVERHVTMADDGTIIRDVWVDKVLPDPESPPGAAVPSPEAAEVGDPAPDTPNAEKDQDFDARRRGVMRNKRYKKGAFQREPTKWGEHLTADHLDSKHVEMQGINGEKEAFAIKDIYSGLLHLYPTKTKNAVETSDCIHHFIGSRPIGFLYSDNSGEIKKACKDIGMNHEFSQQGVPHTNSIIETANRIIIDRVRTHLIRAGLPPRFWSFVAPGDCFLKNVDTEHGESAWFHTHGKEFEGLRIPVGAKVVYKPSSTKFHTKKWEPPSSIGVFAGYKIRRGYEWKGEFLVWDLDDFVGADLHMGSHGFSTKLANPHVTKVCHLFDRKVEYPLKGQYEQANTTFEGKIGAGIRHGEVAVDLPGAPPPIHVLGQEPVPVVVPPSDLDPRCLGEAGIVLQTTDTDETGEPTGNSDVPAGNGGGERLMDLRTLKLPPRRRRVRRVRLWWRRCTSITLKARLLTARSTAATKVLWLCWALTGDRTPSGLTAAELSTTRCLRALTASCGRPCAPAISGMLAARPG